MVSTVEVTIEFDRDALEQILEDMVSAGEISYDADESVVRASHVHVRIFNAGRTCVHLHVDRRVHVIP